jgi:hypothetical protein
METLIHYCVRISPPLDPVLSQVFTVNKKKRIYRYLLSDFLRSSFIRYSLAFRDFFLRGFVNF